MVSEEEREKERGFGKKDKYCAVGSLTSQSSQGHARAHAHCEESEKKREDERASTLQALTQVDVRIFLRAKGEALSS